MVGMKMIKGAGENQLIAKQQGIIRDIQHVIQDMKAQSHNLNMRGADTALSMALRPAQRIIDIITQGYLGPIPSNAKTVIDAMTRAGRLVAGAETHATPQFKPLAHDIMVDLIMLRDRQYSIGQVASRLNTQRDRVASKERLYSSGRDTPGVLSVGRAMRKHYIRMTIKSFAAKGLVEGYRAFTQMVHPALATLMGRMILSRTHTLIKVQEAGGPGSRAAVSAYDGCLRNLREVVDLIRSARLTKDPVSYNEGSEVIRNLTIAERMLMVTINKLRELNAIEYLPINFDRDITETERIYRIVRSMNGVLRNRSTTFA